MSRSHSFRSWQRRYEQPARASIARRKETWYQRGGNRLLKKEVAVLAMAWGRARPAGSLDHITSQPGSPGRDLPADLALSPRYGKSASQRPIIRPWVFFAALWAYLAAGPGRIAKRR